MRAVLNLYPYSRSCRIPAPGGVFGRGGDIHRRCPRLSVVVTPGDPDSSRASGFALLDLRFARVPGIMSQQEPDGPGRFIRDRAGIAACVRAIIPNHLWLAPGLAPIGGALQQQVDVAGI